MNIDQLHVGVLGPFEVRIAGTLVGPAGDRRRGLLALLALEANAVVPVDSLIERMWDGEPPASAVNVVQTYVSAWRKALSERPDNRTVIATVGAGYRLQLAPEQFDRLTFRGLIAQGRRADSEGRFDAAATHYLNGLALWRGPALADLSREPFHARLTAELEADRLQATESWARAALRSGGDPSVVIEALTESLGREPLRESLTELLLWALTAAGRQAEAMDMFMATRRLLSEQLGADPGPALSTMYERILRVDPALQVNHSGAHPITVTATPATSAAPNRVDRFFGRSEDLDNIDRLLESQRLVTLTGPGGAGKTRLAVEVLSRRSASGEPGWFVELAPLRDAALAAPKIANALQIQVAAGTDPLEAIAASLGDLRGLLVLDNLEHLDDIHRVVGELHRCSGQLRLLLTSRVPMRLEGEQQYAVPLLPVPAPDAAETVERLMANDSVRLLVDRARAHDPAFAVHADNASDIAEIARRLEGLPLALEIVAPWLRLLTPSGLVRRLTTESLDVPGRRADVPARHRTLRDTISWSYELLRTDEQELLRRLAVFAGTFSVDAAEGVCSDGSGSLGHVTETLFDLVDRSLVRVVAPVGDQTRFRLLETVREFVLAQDREQAVDRSSLRHEHAHWYSGWAAKLAANSEGPDSPVWLAMTVAEADNLRAAIDFYAESGRSVDWLQLAVDAMTLWFEAGHEQEGEQRLEAALEAAPVDAPARAIGLTYWAWLRATVNRTEAVGAARTALDIARASSDAPVEAFALQTLGGTLDDESEAEAASRAVFEAADRSLELVIRYGPTAPDAVRCGASHNLAALWQFRSAKRSLAYQAEALRLAELEGDRRIIAVNAARLALAHMHTGDVTAARQALARTRELVSTRVTARWEDIVTFAEGMLAHHEGRIEEAIQLQSRLFETAFSGGRPLHTILGAAALADLHTTQSQLDEAGRVIERAGSGGRHLEQTDVARLLVRRARLARLRDDSDAAASDLEKVAVHMDTDSLPPERMIWLLERAALAHEADHDGEARALLAKLDLASEHTEVRRPPWEEARLRSLLRALGD